MTLNGRYTLYRNDGRLVALHGFMCQHDFLLDQTKYTNGNSLSVKMFQKNVY